MITPLTSLLYVNLLRSCFEMNVGFLRKNLRLKFFFQILDWFVREKLISLKFKRKCFCFLQIYQTISTNTTPTQT